MSDSTQADVITAKQHTNTLSIVGLAFALAAFVGASCCALPLILASLGLAGAWIANLEVFVVYRAYFIIAALALIAFGWFVALRRRSSGRTFLILGLATVTVFAALLLSEYEGEISRYLVSLRRK
jgi:mercuric ion transport protein